MVKSPQRRKKGFFMLKVLVFDGGYGGELLADYLEEEIPTLDIIRVIDWRNAEALQDSARQARKIAERAIRPYLGRVDLIIFANYLVSHASLSYFQRKYKDQKFVGISLANPRAELNRKTLILTTKAVSKTFAYVYFSNRHKAKTAILDDWPILIDDGELGNAKMRRDLRKVLNYKPSQIVLACAQFADIKPELQRLFGHDIRYIDNFDIVLNDTVRALKIRGGLKKDK